jgi:FkbM family methyltransferase
MGSRLRHLLLRSERAYRLGRRLYLLARYLARRPHEGDFAAFGQFPNRGKLFLDVGANAGQSALSFRLFNKRAPILSIEANRYHEGDLRFLKRILRNFDFLIVAAGETNGRLTLHVPTLRGVPLTGEASSTRERAESSEWLQEHLGTSSTEGFRVVEQEVEVRRLDDLGLEPGFVKVDVEGAELPVLRGLAETLRRQRPVVLLEWSKAFAAVEEFLADLDYRPFVLDNATGAFEAYRGQPAKNVFCLPSDDSEALAARR